MLTDPHQRSGALPDDETVRIERVQAQLDEIAARTEAEDENALPEVPGYTLLRQLGAGAMGRVFLARQDSLDREVALKVMPAWTANPGDTRSRLLAEARAMARIQHDNVVSIHSVVADPHMAIAMERIDGPSLRELLNERSLTPDFEQFVARIGRDVARALECVHELGLVHRDVKPSNILVRSTGVAALSDFGLVRDLQVSMSMSHGFVGTPNYAAPEQLRCDADVGPTADIYGLGATLFEAMARRPVVSSGAPEVVLDSVQRGDVPRLRRLVPGISRDLETIIHKAIEPAVEDRYATAKALGDDLERFLASEPVRARPISSVGRVARWARRYPLRAVRAAAVSLVTIGLIVACGVLLYELPSIAKGHADRRESEVSRALSSGFSELKGSGRAAAVRHFARALKLDPENVFAVAGYGLALSAQGRSEEAANALDVRADLLASNPALQRLRDMGMRLQGRSERTEAFLAELRSSHDAFGQFLAGILHFNRAASTDYEPDYELALGCFLEAIFSSARSAPQMFYCRLAAAASKAGDLERLRRTRNELRLRWPDDATTEYWIGRAYFGIDQAVAMEAYDRAIEIDPNHVAALNGRVRLLWNQDRQAEALEAARATVAAHPNSVDGHNTLIRMLLSGGELEAACSAAERALLVERSPALLYSYGIVLRKAGEVEAARSAFEEVLVTDPYAWRARVSLAQLLSATDPDAGIAQFRRAADSDPMVKVAQTDCATALAREGRWLEARRYYANAVHLDPSDPKIRYGLGVADYRRGEFAVALVHFRHIVDSAEAYSLSPSVMDHTHYHLGRCLFEMGRETEALEAFDSALALGDGAKPQGSLVYAAWIRVRPGGCRELRDVERAEELLEQARRGGLNRPLLFLVAAECALVRGDADSARRFLARAKRCARFTKCEPHVKEAMQAATERYAK